MTDTEQSWEAQKPQHHGWNHGHRPIFKTLDPTKHGSGPRI